MSEQVGKLQRKKRKHLIITLSALAAAIAFVGLLALGLRNDPTQIPSALLNKPAKDFRVAWLLGKEHLATQDEEHLSLADLKGKPVILNFWASWCYSCRAEARDFEKFWQIYKDKGVIVAGIAIQDSPEAALNFADQYGKTYLLGLDVDGRAAIDYGVTGVPETFVIDKNGRIVHKEAGPVNTMKLAEFAQMIL